MKNEKRVPGEFVNAITCEDVLISAGIQLIHWANDLAFTDAAYGENWCLEAANRMATLSQILHILYESLPRRALELEVKMPPGVVGVMSINPHYVPKSEPPTSDEESGSAEHGGDTPSIDDNPF